MRKEGLVYKTTVPVSDARRDGLRAAEESTAAFLEKAGLAGAKILCLFLLLGVDLEEEPALAISNSDVNQINISQ